MSEDSPEVDELFDEAEIEALRATAPEIVIANHVFHLLELAALYLSAPEPQLSEASLVIDAVAGMLHETDGRLGERGLLLGEGLAQVQLAYVSIAGVDRSGA